MGGLQAWLLALVHGENGEARAVDGLTRRVPAGYSAVDLFPSSSSLDGGWGPLRVCVLVRDEPVALSGRLVLVRDVFDASVYLGCVLDASGAVDTWVEVWVQRVDSLDVSAGGGRGTLSNASLESRWARTVEGLASTAPDMLIRTGYETTNPAPLALDAGKGMARTPMHEATGDDWAICRDEDLLAAKGLGSYRSSLSRYLCVPGLGESSEFIESSDRTGYEAGVLTGVNRDLIPFNMGGGLMMVRRLAPVSFGEQVGVVGGLSWSGVRHGVEAIDLRAGHEMVTRVSGFAGDPEPIDPDRFFLGRHGRWGRLVETLHLKLKMIAEAVNAVRSAVEQTGRPLLNLTDESFRVDLWEGGIGLPRLWTSRVRLVDPGSAFELSIEGLRAAGFVSPDGIGRGVYRPEIGGESGGGRCDFRIREIDESDPGGAVVEATFRTDARVSGGGSELLELRVPADGERLLLYGRARTEEALGRGELRFRSLPVPLTGRVGEIIRSAEGVPLRDVSFEVVPLASTPCDLHALGVLGVRTLLVNGSNTLPVALDELQSLARLASSEIAGDMPIEDAFERAFFSDARWGASLGPQRLMMSEMPAAQAMDLIPPEIWMRVLALLSRMLLGIDGVGFCRDIGDTRGLHPHVVFDEAGAGLSSLLVRTRSLMVVDWRHNREVHAVLRRYREGMASAE